MHYEVAVIHRPDQDVNAMLAPFDENIAFMNILQNMYQNNYESNIFKFDYSGLFAIIQTYRTPLFLNLPHSGKCHHAKKMNVG